LGEDNKKIWLSYYLCVLPSISLCLSISSIVPFGINKKKFFVVVVGRRGEDGLG